MLGHLGKSLKTFFSGQKLALDALVGLSLNLSVMWFSDLLDILYQKVNILFGKKESRVNLPE